MAQRLRRSIAVGLLPCVVFAYALPLPVHERSGGPDCHHSPIVATVVAPDAGSGGLCDHGTSTSCAAMLGCVPVPTALTSSAAPLMLPFAFAAPASFGDGALHGRLGLGPPTPPPNS